ncbi:MAG: class I SAM-dependent methyltransferase [Methanotrichaceae archaeon]
MYLKNVINDPSFLELFLQSRDLPQNYGFRLDARVVEIPWALARLKTREGYLLDAGSSLNHEVILASSPLSNKKIAITTLGPEGECHWQRSISYIFGDLRNMDFRDNLFDIVVCISTIEHIGMDNSMYVKQGNIAKRSGSKDFLIAIRELSRVLKPGGVLYCTFPFGKYEDHGWFQQFDSSLAEELIKEFHPTYYRETVFKYDPDGWKISDRKSCAECEFFDVHNSKYFDPNSTLEYPPDYPAGERAVLCLELFKQP